LEKEDNGHLRDVISDELIDEVFYVFEDEEYREMYDKHEIFIRKEQN
jgi:hypothetical protein